MGNRNFIKSVVLILSILICGCSPVSSTILSSSNAQTASPPTRDQFATHIVETLGNNVGFEAIYLAFKNGYSLAQVAEAGVNNRLGTAGIISDANGVIVTPEYPPATTTRSVNSELSTDITQLRGWLEEQANNGDNVSLEGVAMAMLMALVQKGYDTEQIVEAFLFGYSLKEEWISYGDGSGGVDEEIPIYVIVDEQGNVVEPNRQADTTSFSPPATTTGGGADAGSNSDNSWLLGQWSVTGYDGGLTATGTITFRSDGTHRLVGQWSEGRGNFDTVDTWSLDGSTLTVGSRSTSTWTGTVEQGSTTITVSNYRSRWIFTR